jgi:hypothetical protein
VATFFVADDQGLVFNDRRAITKQAKQYYQKTYPEYSVFRVTCRGNACSAVASSKKDGWHTLPSSSCSPQECGSK